MKEKHADEQTRDGLTRMYHQPWPMAHGDARGSRSRFDVALQLHILQRVVHQAWVGRARSRTSCRSAEEHWHRQVRTFLSYRLRLRISYFTFIAFSRLVPWSVHRTSELYDL